MDTRNLMHEVTKKKVSDRKETTGVSWDGSESMIKTVVLVYSVLRRELQLL
jgi:hypothetical protein